MDFCMKLLKAEWEINQQEREKNSNATRVGKWCYIALKGTAEDSREERNREKKCQKPALQQKTTDDDDDDDDDDRRG